MQEMLKIRKQPETGESGEQLVASQEEQACLFSGCKLIPVVDALLVVLNQLV